MHMKSYHIRVAGREDVSFLLEMLYESLYVPEGEEPFSRDILEEPFMKNMWRTGERGRFRLYCRECHRKADRLDYDPLF